MKRLTKKQIESIKNLSDNGLSLRKIHKITDIPLSTIQYRANKDKKRPRIKAISLPDSDFLKGEIIGAFAGDGNYFYDCLGRCRKHNIRFFLSYEDDKEYKNYLFNLLKSLGLSVNVYVKKYKGKPSCFQIYVSSIEFIRFIKKYLEWKDQKTYSVRLRKDINYSKEFLFGFARGLMDTDGFVESYSVACGTVSKELIKNLREIFMLANIPARVIEKKRNPPRKNLFLTRVKKGNLLNYYKNIGFSNSRKEKKLLEIMNGAAQI